MTIIQWNHAEVQRAATDAAYAAASLNGVSVHSPATGSKAQATLDEKIQGLKQAITDIATKAKTTSENLTTADKAFRDNESHSGGKITKSGSYPPNTAVETHPPSPRMSVPYSYKTSP
ncbi:hypothetical protein [Actinomyces bouchesdurhonensis]|jgi:hypothetical protein|uniref:hypothetical protein n=1 Tax=Actinomyces bouchesdurhonensis TaxID=1852361 RepID=UPI003C766DB6